MINLRFEKKGSAVYVSHIDVLRGINKTIRRADISVDYSKGFNPHMLLNLSQPLPMGIASEAEWVTLTTEEKNADRVMRLYNENCPMGFSANLAIYTALAKNIAGRVVASDYFVKTEKAYAVRDSLLSLNKGEYFVDFPGKKETVRKEVSQLIYKIEVTEEGIYFLLAFGNKNLRIDRLCNQLNTDFGLGIENTDIVRKSQYVEENDKFILTEDYLRS